MRIKQRFQLKELMGNADGQQSTRTQLRGVRQAAARALIWRLHLVVLQLVEEPVAEGHRKHVKREHSGRDLGADAPERRVASRRRLCRIRVRVRCVQRVPEPLCEPVALRTRGEVKKLRVEAHAAVLNLRLHLVRLWHETTTARAPLSIA
eukprot:4951154-Pleurochrysis_carterae.AAC.3